MGGPAAGAGVAGAGVTAGACLAGAGVTAGAGVADGAPPQAKANAETINNVASRSRGSLSFKFYHLLINLIMHYSSSWLITHRHKSLKFFAETELLLYYAKLILRLSF